SSLFSFTLLRRPPTPTLFPYTTLFRSDHGGAGIACEVSEADDDLEGRLPPGEGREVGQVLEDKEAAGARAQEFGRGRHRPERGLSVRGHGRGADPARCHPPRPSTDEERGPIGQRLVLCGTQRVLRPAFVEHDFV